MERKVILASFYSIKNNDRFFGPLNTQKGIDKFRLSTKVWEEWESYYFLSKVLIEFMPLVMVF